MQCKTLVPRALHACHEKTGARTREKASADSMDEEGSRTSRASLKLLVGPGGSSRTDGEGAEVGMQVTTARVSGGARQEDISGEMVVAQGWLWSRDDWRRYLF